MLVMIYGLVISIAVSFILGSEFGIIFNNIMIGTAISTFIMIIPVIALATELNEAEKECHKYSVKLKSQKIQK